MTLQHYLVHRRRYETLMWLIWSIFAVTANCIISRLDLQRMQQDFLWWHPICWEVSSMLMLLLLLPIVVLLERRFPLERSSLIKHLTMHVAITPLFSLAHVLGMVTLRKITYTLAGGHYNFGNWLTELGYEYIKDAQTYVGILVVISLYRLIIRRLQGEATLPDETETDSSPADRFLVKKLGKEFLVRITDIDWLEASGNYVNLHAHNRVYPMRETMTSMAKRLLDQGFVRVHRSIILNLDRVQEIEPLDTGDARARLISGDLVPISRRYRQQLRERLS